MTDIFDSILDTNLDDIADLPEYADYVPNGLYHLKIVESEKKTVETTNKDTKQKENAPVVQITYEIVEAKELKDPTEEPLVKPNMRFNESYWFNGDKERQQKSMEVMKVKYKALADQFGWKNLSEMIAGMKGLDVLALVTSKRSKDDSDKFFINTKNMQAL